MANIIDVPGQFTPREYGVKLAKLSDIDNNVYGPYESVAAAHTALSAISLNVVGVTVGIIGANNTIVEYWYQGGTSQNNLVEKQQDIDATPTYGSEKAVSSNGVFSELADLGRDVNLLSSVSGTEVVDSGSRLTPAAYKAGDIFYVEEGNEGQNFSQFVYGVKYYVAKADGNAGADLDSYLFDNTYSCTEALRLSAKYGGSEQIQSDWNQTNQQAKDFIKNKPTIPTVPTNVSAFNNDANYVDAQALSQAIEGKANASDVYTKSETYNKTELDNMITTPNQEYVTVTATGQTTDVTDLLPATGASDTTYRVGNWDGTQYNDSVFSEYAWNGSTYIKLSTKSQVGEVYDISANHADAKYADLAAALNGGANVPQSLRKGGMSVKFVQSSDNKYVQYRLMADAFSTDVTQWQGVDSVVIKKSHNLVESGAVEEAIENSKIVDGGLSTEAELSFVDEESNCIAQFKGGHIKTKEFDSKEAALKQDVAEVDDIEEDEESLSFVDEEDDCIALFKGGHVKTKYFDSANAAMNNDVANVDDLENNDKSISFVDEESNCIAQFKGGHVRTKYFDSKVLLLKGTKIKDLYDFSGDSWTIADNKKSAITSTLNKRLVYQYPSYEACFNLSASFIPVGTTFEVGFGKLYRNGTLVTITNSGVKLYVISASGGDYSYGNAVYSENFTNVVVESGKKISIRLEKKTTTADLYTIIVTDQYGNVDKFENISAYISGSEHHALGNVFFVMLSGTSMTVQDVSFGYNIKDGLDAIIIGHSYVEGNNIGSTGGNKSDIFASLVTNDIGSDYCLPLGLGGENTTHLLTYIDNYCLWFANSKYALMYIGGNDVCTTVGTANYDSAVNTLKTNMMTINDKLKAVGITPIWCTLNWWLEYGKPQTDTLNPWILETFDNVVDVTKVFENSDGTLNADMFAPDGVHPSIAGHRGIYNAIKAQASYMFNI